MKIEQKVFLPNKLAQAFRAEYVSVPNETVSTVNNFAKSQEPGSSEFTTLLTSIRDDLNLQNQKIESTQEKQKTALSVFNQLLESGFILPENRTSVKIQQFLNNGMTSFSNANSDKSGFPESDFSQLLPGDSFGLMSVVSSSIIAQRKAFENVDTRGENGSLSALINKLFESRTDSKEYSRELTERLTDVFVKKFNPTSAA